MANDPYQNAPRLRGTKIYMTTGTGIPGRNDTMGAKLVDNNPVALANQVLVGGLIESAVNLCTQQMAQRLAQLHPSEGLHPPQRHPFVDVLGRKTSSGRGR